MGEYLLEQLGNKLSSHKNVGEIRGLGLFAGVELVEDRETKEPMHESKLAAIAGDCMKNGVIIGRTNRSLPNLNNTLTLCPALIASEADIDQIVNAIVNAMDTVLSIK